MDPNSQHQRRPLALVILDGWGHAPKSNTNAIAVANTPFYDEICKRYPMTTLAASGESVGQSIGALGNAEVGHLNLGTGRRAQTEIDRIKAALLSGEFERNDVLDRAFRKAKEKNTDVHLIGLLSDGGVHSSLENLLAILRLAKQHGLTNVFIHGILDGLDVPARTADIYVEAIEIKLSDIGIGKIASLCGRFFAMDSTGHWERTARAFTTLVHAEGERHTDAVSAIRNSFLRGISDEFISPIVIEGSPDVALAKVKNDDLVVFFNHRADGMQQLVRAVCVADESAAVKPVVDTVCLMEYDRAFNLPAAFRQAPEKGTLTETLSANEVANFKITEAARFQHLTHFFDGGSDTAFPFEEQILVGGHSALQVERPESHSFKIADRVLRGLEAWPSGVFVANLPAADVMATSGDISKTVAAVQFVDTCLEGICDSMQKAGGIVIVTSSHGRCEAMPLQADHRFPHLATGNPVPFHLIGDEIKGLRSDGTLADVSPTILGLLGLERPGEMTGYDLRLL